jgi:hypothetical protein
MKLFCVTKKTLDLGFGIAPPEWSCVVRAESVQEVKQSLKWHGATDFVTIRELVGLRLSQFETFLKENVQPEDDSRQVTDDEVEDMLGGL